MNEKQWDEREERLLRLLDEADAAAGDPQESAWLKEQRHLSRLLSAAYPAPAGAPEKDAFFRSLTRRLSHPEKAPLWWPLGWWGRYRLVAALACAALAAVVWWEWPGAIGSHRGPMPPGTIAQAPPTTQSTALEALAEIDEIDADTPAYTGQLPDSLTPVVLFSWSGESENNVPSG